MNIENIKIESFNNIKMSFTVRQLKNILNDEDFDSTDVQQECYLKIDKKEIKIIYNFYSKQDGDVELTEKNIIDNINNNTIKYYINDDTSILITNIKKY